MDNPVATGKHYGTKAVDLRGRKIQVGDYLARGRNVSSSAEVEVVRVTKVEGGKVFCGNSSQPLRYPGRTLVVNEVYEAKPEVKKSEGTTSWYHDGV